jgi:hypothetical protein
LKKNVDKSATYPSSDDQGGDGQPTGISNFPVIKDVLQGIDAATGDLLFQAVDAKIQEAAETEETKEDVKQALQKSKEDLRGMVDQDKGKLDDFVKELKTNMNQYVINAIRSFKLLEKLSDLFWALIRQGQ